MSVEIMTSVWRQSRHAGTELLLLLALADYADPDGGNIYPGIKALARKCRMSTRNVNHILTALQASGELVVKRNDGPNGTNRYQLRPAPTAPLKPASSPEADFTLKPASCTPEAGVPKPLKPASPKSSLNRQEPPEGARKRGARNCPTTFIVTADMEAWAQAECPSVDFTVETAKFRDHTFKSPVVDWSGAWRNWIRRSVQFGAEKAPQRQPQVGEARPAWALAAGFKNRFDAENAGCHERNAQQFAYGRQKEPA